MEHEEKAFLLQRPAFGRLTNGIWSTAPPVPMNFSPWISWAASRERVQKGGNGEVVVCETEMIIPDFRDIILSAIKKIKRIPEDGVVAVRS